MTPRERAEAAPSDRAIIAAALWSGENLPALLDEFAAARVRALLADDGANIDAIEAAWEHEPEVWTPRHAAQVALAALRRKAGIE